MMTFDELEIYLQPLKDAGKYSVRHGDYFFGETEDGRALFEIFQPLLGPVIDEIETELSAVLPFPLRRIFLHMNGAHLFSNQISFHGVRRSFAREGPNAHQPFDINIFNLYGRLPEMCSDEICFASYGREDAIVTINSKCTVRKRSRLDGLIGFTWQSLSCMMKDEFKRLAADH